MPFPPLGKGWDGGWLLGHATFNRVSDNYEAAAKKELGSDCPQVEKKDDSNARPVQLALWYANNPADVTAFEKQMRRKVGAAVLGVTRTPCCR